MSGAAGRWLLVAAGTAMAAAVVAALVVTGGPGTQRQLRLDERRTSDLAALERAVEAHARREGSLPADLETLVHAAQGAGERVPRHDPEGAPYRYEPVDDRRFRLCARFAEIGRAHV